MEKLDKILRTGIWHITSLHSLRGILKDGYIYPNIDNKYKITYPQTNNSLAKKNNCISLFDLENISDEIYHDSIYTTQRYSIVFAHKPLSIAINLNRNKLPKLIPYAKIENKNGVIIAHIECLYPEPIPTTAIDKILILDDLNYEDFPVIGDNFTYESISVEVDKRLPARKEEYCKRKKETNERNYELYKAILERGKGLEQN